MHRSAPLAGPLKPTGSFPSTWDADLGGGFRVVFDINELVSIPRERLTPGSLVYIRDKNKFYQYNKETSYDTSVSYNRAPSNIWPDDWSPAKIGGDEDGVRIEFTVVDTQTWKYLLELRKTGKLKPGVWYKILDYRFIQPDIILTQPDTNTGFGIQQGPQEPLLIRAETPYSFARDTYSVGYWTSTPYEEQRTDITSDLYGYPGDIIEWEVPYLDNEEAGKNIYSIVNDYPEWSRTLFTHPLYRGTIIRRIDPVQKIEAPYDWRSAQFKRWTSNPDEPNRALWEFTAALPYQYINMTSAGILYPITEVVIELYKNNPQGVPDSSLPYTRTIPLIKKIQSVEDLVYNINKWLSPDEYALRVSILNETTIAFNMLHWYSTGKPIWNIQALLLNGIRFNTIPVYELAEQYKYKPVISNSKNIFIESIPIEKYPKTIPNGYIQPPEGAVNVSNLFEETAIQIFILPNICISNAQNVRIQSKWATCSGNAIEYSGLGGDIQTKNIHITGNMIYARNTSGMIEGEQIFSINAQNTDIKKSSHILLRNADYIQSVRAESSTVLGQSEKKINNTFGDITYRLDGSYTDALGTTLIESQYDSSILELWLPDWYYGNVIINIDIPEQKAIGYIKWKSQIESVPARPAKIRLIPDIGRSFAVYMSSVLLTGQRAKWSIIGPNEILILNGDMYNELEIMLYPERNTRWYQMASWTYV